MSIIHGVDANSKVKPLLVDATGRAIVVIGAGTNNIGDVDIASFDTLYGIIAKKNVDIIDSIVTTEKLELNLPSGLGTLNGDAVAANKIMKVTTFRMWYRGTITNVAFEYGIVSGGVYRMFGYLTPIISDYSYMLSVEWYVDEGNYVYLRSTNSTLNDDLGMSYHGYLISKV
jgi:hypothetical protein